ncbi:MAG: sugar phosphate isomerase/epimerase family protein [Devosia sp.]|jgi:protein FrlC
MGFKYSFNTWCYSSFPVWVPSYSLEEAARRIAAAGYDGIEIGCAAPHAWPAHLSPGRRAELKSLFADLGLTVSSLLPAPGGGPGNNPTSLLPEERAATIAHYKEVIDLARDLGSERVLYIAGWRSFGVSREDALGWSLDALVAIGKYAAERGVTICIEPTSADSNLIDTAGEALRLREQSGLSNVKVMFDTYHALYRNEVSSDYVYEMAPHLAHVHFADLDRLPPGEGVVDWVGVMQALRDVSFDGFVTMEIGFAARRVEPDRYARSAITYLKSIENGLR